MLLMQAGVHDLIEDAAISSDAEQSKPDPDIVEAALEKTGLHVNEAIMVGDTPYDVEAADAAGVTSIALRCGGFWSTSAFRGAAAVYDHPADLLRNIASSPIYGETYGPSPAPSRKLAEAIVAAHVRGSLRF